MCQNTRWKCLLNCFLNCITTEEAYLELIIVCKLFSFRITVPFTFRKPIDVNNDNKMEILSIETFEGYKNKYSLQTIIKVYKVDSFTKCFLQSCLNLVAAVKCRITLLELGI